MQLSRYGLWLTVIALVSMSACKFNCQVGSGVTGNIEDKILEEQKAAGITSVSCPGSPDLTEGTTFECTAEGDSGLKKTFVVTVGKKDGAPWFTWTQKQ